MPSVGLGTAQNKDRESIVGGIMDASYVHVDTAAVYKNEEVVGEALANCFALGK